jgi:hypothetical protein
MRALAAVLVALVLVAAADVGAAPPRGRTNTKEPPAPSAPSPDVRLAVEAPTTTGPWTMRVTNAGQVPVRLVADARLLVLEVTLRGEAKPVRCQLPADMRPADDMSNGLVLPPGRSYAETFEPRLYCFGPRELTALTPGATVVGRLGWPGNKDRPPFVVSPFEGVEPVVAAMKTVDSPPIMLPDEPTPSAAPPVAPAADDPDPVKLSVTGSKAVDAASPNGIAVTVTLHNDGKRPVTLRFRPETLSFEVAGASGIEHCGWPTLPGAPMRELLTTLRPGGSESLAVMLRDYCSGHALDAAGLLVVRPALDTRQASGASIGVKTFDGEVIATTPTVVRLHQGLVREALRHPHLEPAK